MLACHSSHTGEPVQPKSQEHEVNLLSTHECRHVFRVRCDLASQVKLVIEFRPGVSEIYSLRPCGKGMWEITLNLPPGEYRYCYHAYDGRSLTYITPPAAPLDGLKAVLHVQPSTTAAAAPIRAGSASLRYEVEPPRFPNRLGLRDVSTPC